MDRSLVMNIITSYLSTYRVSHVVNEMNTQW